MAAQLLRPAATAIDWEIIKGETFDIVVPVLGGAPPGTPITVDDWTAKAQVRRSEREPLLHEWSADHSNITVAGTAVTLAVVGSVTTAWTWTDAMVSVEVTEPDGTEHVIAQGSIRALPEITR